MDNAQVVGLMSLALLSGFILGLLVTIAWAIKGAMVTYPRWQTVGRGESPWKPIYYVPDMDGALTERVVVQVREDETYVIATTTEGVACLSRNLQENTP